MYVRSTSKLTHPSVHPPLPFLLRGGGGGGSWGGLLTKFSKRGCGGGGLTGSQFLEGGCWERGG